MVDYFYKALYNELLYKLNNLTFYVHLIPIDNLAKIIIKRDFYMPENKLAKLPINQVYTLLKKNCRCYPEGDLYKKSSDDLLAIISKKLNATEELVSQLEGDRIKMGLINPKLKSTADELVKKINGKLTVTPDSIKEQLDEFIDFSELIFFALSKLSLFSQLRNKTTLENFAFLTKLKFNLFLNNLSQLLVSTDKKSVELETIAEILIKYYLPTVAAAEYDRSTKLILSLYQISEKELKNAIEKNDIPSLQKSLDTYQKNMGQKETVTQADRSDNDDEDYHSCCEFPVNETKDLNQFNRSGSASYYSCYSDDDRDEGFFDVEEDCPLDKHALFTEPKTKLDKKPSSSVNPGLLQRLLNWFRKLIHNLVHIIRPTQETPPSTRLSTVQEIEPINLTDRTFITSSIHLGKSSDDTPPRSIDDWKKQKGNPIYKSTGNLFSFYLKNNRETLVSSHLKSNSTPCLFRTISLPFQQHLFVITMTNISF